MASMAASLVRKDEQYNESGKQDRSPAMNVTLSSEHEKLVREKLRCGEFDSADALVAHALESLVVREQEDQRHRQAIREKIDRGIEQLAHGEGVDGEQVFAELEAELDEIEAARPTG